MRRRLHLMGTVQEPGWRSKMRISRAFGRRSRVVEEGNDDGGEGALLPTGGCHYRVCPIGASFPI